MKNLKFLALLASSALLVGPTFATVETIPVQPTGAPIPEMHQEKRDRIPPHTANPNYNFDETLVRQLAAKSGTLLQLDCQSDQILKNLNFSQTTDGHIFSLGIKENGYDLTFDFRNCSLRGNKSNAIRNHTRSITPEFALETAQKFIDEMALRTKIFRSFGAPVVQFKNSQGPIFHDARGAKSELDLSDIEIIDSDESIEQEFSSISILFPFEINGLEIRNNRGQPAGLTIEVTADGVQNFNANLLPFTATRKSSQELTPDQTLDFIKNGGNNPFRGQTREIQLDVERILVLFPLRRDGTNSLFLSSGIGLKSEVRTDQRAQQPYSMIISDFLIGNNQNLY